LISLLAIANQSRAQAPKPSAAITPAEADSDFALQGEYAGEIDRNGEKVKYGVQIIAKGDHKFHAVAHRGGFPGEGWNGEDKPEADGELQNGAVKFEHDGTVATLKNGMLTVTAGGNQIGELRKVERKSSTLGAKPPAGATVLFDGTSVDAFVGGKKTDDGLLIQGTTSKLTFQNATVHLEFMVSYMPTARDQGRANSGCYLQGRYEVQILDSFGLAGKNNECGGLYEIKDPDVNMCYPPLSWQTYDIDFTAAKFDADGKKSADARMTVKHNGVLVHNNVAVPRSTRASPLQEGPEPGPLYLQDHGNPIRFRNIWVVVK